MDCSPVLSPLCSYYFTCLSLPWFFYIHNRKSLEPAFLFSSLQLGPLFRGCLFIRQMALPDLYTVLSLLLVASSTLVSAETCGPVHYNASGSVNLPFPHPPTSSPSDPSGNYTLSTQLSFPAGSLGLNQSFRAVSASGYVVDNKPVDYEGCIIAFGDSSWPVTQGHINEPDQASCQSAFSSDCISKIVSYASETASGFSQQNMLANRVCGQFTTPKCAEVGAMYSSGNYTAASEFEEGPETRR